MFGIFKRYKRLFSREAAESFNRMAAFLTNFCSNESIRFERPDEPSADNPPCISVDADWMAGNFVTVDTPQTITGAKTFNNAITAASADSDYRSNYDRGRIELFHDTPYIDFHFGVSETDYTSRIIEISSGALEIISPNHARLHEHPADTTYDASSTSPESRQIATVGFANSHYWRIDDTASGFMFNDEGVLSYVDFGTTSGTIAEGDHTHTTSDIDDWATATDDFLTAADLADYITSTDLTTTLQGYALANHAHSISDFTAPNCSATPQSPCFLISDATNGIYHSSQNPSVATVRAICTEWTNNGNSFGTGTSNLTHTDITDWATATSGFLTSSDLSSYVTTSDLSTELASYVTTSDLSTELADYVTSSGLATELADYATAQTVLDLADIVDGILADYVTTSDLSGYVTTSDLSGYVTTSDLSGYLQSSDFPNNFLTACTNGKTTSFNCVHTVTWNGTKLEAGIIPLYFTNGLLTSHGPLSTTTIDTAVTYNA